jgi:hypothetical protein
VTPAFVAVAALRPFAAIADPPRCDLQACCDEIATVGGPGSCDGLVHFAGNETQAAGNRSTLEC